MFQDMLNKLRSIFKKDRFPDGKVVTEYAFTVGGIDYFQHVDEMNLPYKRALTVLTYYNELNSKIDSTYLDEHTKAVDAIFERKQIGFSELASLKALNEQMKERRQMVFIPDHLYKLASVRFFDKNENPNDYDFKYNEKKIAHWKKHESAGTFFLRERIQNLIPFLKSAPFDLEQYSEMAEKMAQAQLENISLISSLNLPKGLLNSIDKQSSKATQAKK